MHIYVYDNYLIDKKYYNILSQLETRITDLGLNGKIIRLDVMKNIQSAIDREIKQGAKTIIAVGNDKSLSKTLNAVIKYEKNYGKTSIPVGFIPVDKKENIIHETLGIPLGIEACDVLSARRIEVLDVGMAGSSYFLANAKITGEKTIIQAEQGYTIDIVADGEIEILNMDMDGTKNSNPKDGVLNLIIKTSPIKKLFRSNSKNNLSNFSFKQLILTNQKNEQLILDNGMLVSTPAEISILPKQINLIVGRERRF